MKASLRGPRANCVEECNGVNTFLSVCCSAHASDTVMHVETCSTIDHEGGSVDQLFPAPPSDSASGKSSEPHEGGLPQTIGRDSGGKDAQVYARDIVFTLKTNILRGVRSDVVLRRCANLLSNGEGSAATFQLSQPADHLDAFISHNWCVSRGKKWLALSLHYNLFFAGVGAVLTTAVVALMTILGFLPLHASDGRREREGVYCRVFGSVVFGSLVLFLPDVVPRCCAWHSTLFLDKSCIHQVDLDLQRKGIEGLGAFLYFSWSLVVLYTRVYTQKVWTVYEMACFLFLHPEGHLVWLPVNLPPVILMGSVATGIADIFLVMAQLPSVRSVVPIPDFVITVLYLPCILVVHVMFRRVSRDQARSLADLECFSIKDAVCTVERDRVTVEDNVVSLMLHLKCVPSDCSREDALSAFDMLVRRNMPRRIRASTGRTLLRYEYVFSMQITSVLSVFDVACAHWVAGDSTRRLIGAVIEAGTRTWAGFPLSYALSLWMSSFCQNLRGPKDIMYILFVSFINYCTGFLIYVLLRLLQTFAIENELYLVVLCAMAAGLFTLTCFVFRRSPGEVRRRRTGTAAESTEEIAEALARTLVREESSQAENLHGG